MPPRSNGNGFDPGAGRLLGNRDLQSSIDSLTSAVTTLTTAVNGSRQGNGTSTAPFMSQSSQGQTFTTGSLNGMAAGGGANGGGANGGGANGGGAGVPFRGAVLLGQQAAGGGANGGGPTVAGRPFNWGQYNQPAGRTFSNGHAQPIGPQPAGPGGTPPPPGGGPPAGTNGGFTFGQPAVQAAGNWAVNTGMSQLGNMTLINAYGAQMQAQWGGSAQAWQSGTFGNGANGGVWAAAGGNAQQAASAYGTLTQLAGGANVASTAAFQATNALAFANQGMGAAGAAQLAATIYNPQRALQQQMLTGVSAYGPGGQQAGIGQQIMGLAQSNYIGGGGYNSKTGTFSQSALNASFATGRGSSYVNLQALGYNSSQIQDIQGMLSQANQAATKGGTSVNSVLNLMNTAGGGPNVGMAQVEGADKKLASMGVDISTLQLQGNASAQNLSQQQSESSTYNDSVKGFTDGMTRLTQAVNWFLDKTGLGKVVGGVQGAGAGYSSSGASTWASGAASVAGIGGGAATVSTTQPMTSQGSSSGSTMTSGVSGQVAMAVKDAEAQRGKPYVYGGASPATSFDCSGLVMWAYGQAGVKLPRTSEAQWAALSGKSVAPGQAREGDIVFAAGSDGSAQQPGHEALMISNSQIVEAPHTGANIRVRAYNAGEWQHAARPVGGTGNGGTSSSISGNTASGAAGNSGAALAAMGTYGSTEEVDAITSALAGAVSGGASLATGTNGSATVAGSGNTQDFSGGGNASQNQALAQKMAASLYGWAGSEWTKGLLPLWTQESGFITNATNQGSGAYGIPQALPGSKMASAGSDWKTNPATQIKWGLGYIHDRYGDPMAAEAHETAMNWYAGGTPNAAPGVALVGERGPELVRLTGGQQIMNASQTSSILRGQSSVQAPWTASPAQRLLLDTLSPGSNAARQGGGVSVSVTVAPNAICITGGGGQPGIASDVNTLSSAFSAGVLRAIDSSALLRNIAQGVTD